MFLEEIILVKRSVMLNGFNLDYKGVSGLDGFLQEVVVMEVKE